MSQQVYIKEPQLLGWPQAPKISGPALLEAREDGSAGSLDGSNDCTGDMEEPWDIAKVSTFAWW